MSHRRLHIVGVLALSLGLSALIGGCSGQANTAQVEPNQVRPEPKPPEPPQPKPAPEPGPTNTGDPGPDKAPPAKK
jgi:hypothetical protein